MLGVSLIVAYSVKSFAASDTLFDWTRVAEEHKSQTTAAVTIKMSCNPTDRGLAIVHRLLVADGAS